MSSAFVSVRSIIVFRPTWNPGKGLFLHGSDIVHTLKVSE